MWVARRKCSLGALGLVLVVVLTLCRAVSALAGESVISSRGAVAMTPGSTTRVVLAVPRTARPGDVLIAWLSLRTLGSNSRSGLLAPTGWTSVLRKEQGAVGTVAIYWHVLAAGERRYVWTTGAEVDGVAFMAAFRGGDTRKPIDGFATSSTHRLISTPSVTTTASGDTLVSSYFTYTGVARPGSGPSSFSRPPHGMKQLRRAANGAGVVGSLDYGVEAKAGRSGLRTMQLSIPQANAAAALIALRPARPVPLIIDTDIFSDADDVGALAMAFALQLRHEAHVIAIGVNTRTSRPAVAANSWKCAAAVAQFVRRGNTPVGTDLPNDGTDTNTADFIGPCSKLASPATPIPPSAVSVFRRALVGEADGSVVIAESRYSENLAALLSSPGDAVSPLSGRDLVAEKVKELVILARGYPTRAGETNLSGDPAAAQAVAAGWPTKVVWSGYEIGDAIRTGDTISTTHPSNSPLRVSYEAFVGPDKWTYSYDLVAVYYAVRPFGPVLGEVGPGTNVIDDSGGNSFALGAGHQYYLTLSDAASLSASIEELLDTLPAR